MQNQKNNKIKQIELQPIYTLHNHDLSFLTPFN
jgi:hypothetical protein